MAKKDSLPGWFPFAVVASGLVMIGAGIRSGWKLAADQPPPPPPNPLPPSPVAQAGVLHDWAEGGVLGPHGGGGGHGGGGHGGGGHGHGGGHGGHGRPLVARGGGFRGGPWWGGWDDGVAVTQTCRTWGNPIDMPPAMQIAAQIALGTTMRGSDGVLYRFALENGIPTARACVDSAVA